MKNTNKHWSPNISDFDSGTRTKAVKLHVSLTFIFKTLAIGLSYLLIPLTINYLNIEQYGIWMTLLSLITWVTFFDIGLGSGMRNKLAEALATNDTKLAKTYVSTTYAAVGFIALIIFILLISILPFIPWNKVFNTTSIGDNELLKIVFIVGFFFFFNFVLSLYRQIFYAYQQASIVAVGQLLLNLFALITIYFLVHYTTSNLFYLGTSYGVSMVLSSLLLTYYLYKKHNKVIPSMKYVDLSKVKEIGSLGVKFFIIQMAVLVILATDNMIITQILGPEHVTPYDVVRKLFGIIILGHTILVTPLWSAYTEAYAKGDIKWIKKTLKKLNMLIVPIIIAVVILVIFARDIINIWVGPNIRVPYLLVVFMGIYTIISIWNNNFGYILAGISKIRLSVVSATLGGIINIPVSIYLAKTMGISGVILGTIISLSFSAILHPIRAWYFIFSKKRSSKLDNLFS